jgi:glutamate/tyrosine decarboxylase-like PLP-dependent enzyme
LGPEHFPSKGESPQKLLEESAKLLFDHSLFNGHPRFWGYITSSAAPIGALADMLASAVNPNVGGWVLSPVASEIESQTIRWIAELIGYSPTAGGILVSGGNMANFIGFLAGRRAKAPWDVREIGLHSGPKQLLVYSSKSTHTWIQKAADLFGLGTKSLRWIPTNSRHQMDVDSLENQIAADIKAGHAPIMVVATAGTVETGAIDPIAKISTLCKKHNLWLHIDGAYGAPAGVLPEAPDDIKAMKDADSIAVDPHKWLYAPLEAGCALVRDPQHLLDAFSFRPKYYTLEQHGDEESHNFFELGMQNSRGFRALKVWLALRQVGKEGYIHMIRDDISLAKAMYDRVAATPGLEAVTCNLSITTFRFVPSGLDKNDAEVAKYLNELNEEILTRLQKGGEVFLSNAFVDDRYLMRACIVNFRTTLTDVEALPEIVVRVGTAADKEMRPATIRNLVSK